MNSVLPAHSGKIERALEKAFSLHIERYEIPDIWNPWTCPRKLLPFLADAVSVDFWDENWPDATKRSAIAESVAIHSRKGTLNSILRALKAMGYGDAEIRGGFQEPTFDSLCFGIGEVFSEPMQWYEYSVALNNPISTEMMDRIGAVLHAVTPARCRLVRVKADLINVTFDGMALDSGLPFDAVINYDGGESV